MSKEFISSRFINPVKNKKGYAWIKTTYKKLLFNECSCGNIVSYPKKKCEDCLEKEHIENRTKTCPVCGSIHVLSDEKFGGERICPECKKQDILFLFHRVSDFINHPKKYFHNILNMDEKIHRFALKSRNDIQSISEYPDYKLYHIEFESVDPSKDKTFDHINAMTFIMENYIKKCIKNPRELNEYYFYNYIRKYAVQVRVSQKQNMELAKFQRIGITPEQYVSVVGPIKNKTIDETIEILKPYFLVYESISEVSELIAEVCES